MSGRERGMTLVEVAVASMILAMIMMGLVMALRTFAGTYGAVDQVGARTAELREVSSFLRHSLREATFPAAEAFDARNGELIWMAPLDRVGAAGGLAWLRLENSDGELLLHFALQSTEEEMDNRSSNEPMWDEVITPQVLLSGVEAFSISILPDVEDEWQEPPEQELTGLPHSVKLKFLLADFSWPDLVVSLDAHQGLLR